MSLTLYYIGVIILIFVDCYYRDLQQNVILCSMFFSAPIYLQQTRFFHRGENLQQVVFSTGKNLQQTENSQIVDLLKICSKSNPKKKVQATLNLLQICLKIQSKIQRKFATNFLEKSGEICYKKTEKIGQNLLQKNPFWRGQKRYKKRQIRRFSRDIL